MVIALYVSSAAAVAGLPGVATLQVDVPERAQPLGVTVWYPATQGTERVSIGDSAVFEGTRGLRDAAVAEGVFPVVLVSQGGMRYAPHLGEWIGAALAQRGFIALVVPSPRLGPADAGIAVAELWKRPADLSASLSALEHCIGAVLIVDSEMSGAFSVASLAAIKTPVLVLNQGEASDILPELDASGLAGLYPSWNITAWRTQVRGQVLPFAPQQKTRPGPIYAFMTPFMTDPIYDPSAASGGVMCND